MIVQRFDAINVRQLEEALTQKIPGLTTNVIPALARKILWSVQNADAPSLFRVKKTDFGACNVTFWVEMHAKNRFDVHINIPVKQDDIKQGTYKRVKPGHELALPACTTQCYVRLRPKKRTWHTDALSGFLLHNELFLALHNPAANICIAIPPHPRSEHQNPRQHEYIQAYYPFTLRSCIDNPNFTLAKKIEVFIML